METKICRRRTDLQFNSLKRMSFEFLGPVEKVTISDQVSAAINIAKVFCNVDHFGIEVAYPLHFIFCVRQR